MGYHNFNFNSF
jgi:hypothetical protein